jgi:B12-binding domain/radical SAM domain protein of rhizo-twelve system
MRFALVNPAWTFDGSIYFGCREPHLALELGYARALLERSGHDTLLIDGHLHNLSPSEIAVRTAAFKPDRIVIPTAPTYLFWRCAPPELRVAQETLHSLANASGIRVIVGPHASTTPATTLRKLAADVAVLGECEDTIVELARDPADWDQIPSIAYMKNGELRVQGEPHAVDLSILPALRWTADDMGPPHPSPPSVRLAA